ncbi:MAG TPA: zf-HC2 domain-containing protein [Gemmatimonadaceae bacterium]|nr:zf-HC2 domain-containing protein [Gemmatimonadaceae bacterium]
MDCRQFRKLHMQFVDDTLPGVETWAVRSHMATCTECAKLDARVRRSLMLARSTPTLEVSEGFQRKLAARLAAERLAGTPVMAAPVRPARWMRGAIAALFLGAAGLGIAASQTGMHLGRGAHFAPAPTLTMSPVVVVPPALPSEPVAAPAMFATVSSSLPVYPAMLLAQRATAQFAAMHARTVAFQATH